jgi:hypothetical protein
MHDPCALPQRDRAEGEVRLGLSSPSLNRLALARWYLDAHVIAYRTPPERLHRILPPQPGAKAPAGAGWIHEIKLDRLPTDGVPRCKRWVAARVGGGTMTCLNLATRGVTPDRRSWAR